MGITHTGSKLNDPAFPLNSERSVRVKTNSRQEQLYQVMTKLLLVCGVAHAVCSAAGARMTGTATLYWRPTQRAPRESGQQSLSSDGKHLQIYNGDNMVGNLFITVPHCYNAVNWSTFRQGLAW